MNELVRAGAFAADMAREALVRASRARAPRRARPDGEPLYVIFTIDTEISMGGAARNPKLAPVGPKKRIWAETPRGDYGISYFMDVFDEYGMKAVFFYEPVARFIVGESELAEAAQFIIARGHDVELHVHPEFEADLGRVQRGEAQAPNAFLYTHGYEEQRRYVRENLNVLSRWTGRRPTTFRAGGYSANEVTLRVLADEGISIDSSYNLWAMDIGWCGMKDTRQINDAAWLDPGILEIPVTTLQAKGLRGGARPFELSALNTTEMIAVLDQLYEAGARTACAVTHSFRLVRARDIQYRDVTIDRFNVHRLRALCRFLARNRDRFRVVTFRELPVERWRSALQGRAGLPYFPTPPAWSSFARLVVQAVKDRGAV